MTSRTWLVHATAALVLLIQALLLVGSSRDASPTIDEPQHIGRGLSYWWSGDSFWTADTRLSYAHPPVANALQALPTVLGPSEPIDLRGAEGWERANQIELVEEITSEYASARQWIMDGRMVTVGFTLLLGLSVYLFGLRYGHGTALASLVLYALHLGVLGHGNQLTTDMPAAATMFFAVLAFLRYLERRGVGWALLAGAAVGLAITTKYSALMLPPLLFAFALVRAVREGRRAVLLLLRDGLLATVPLLLVINAAYRFQDTGWTVERLLETPDWINPVTDDLSRPVLTKTPLVLLPEWTPVPLPRTFLVGVASIKAQGEMGHSTWLAGRRYGGGFWVYFPVLFLIKTPAGFLALLAIGLAMQLRERRRPDLAIALVAWVTLALAVLLLTAKLNISFRHALPIVPFVAVLGGRIAVRLAERHRAIAVLLVALSALPALVRYPEYIGSFNLLIGNTWGHRISMVGEDWGQDLGQLAREVEARGYQPLYFAPYGRWGDDEVAWQGLTYRRAPCRTPPPTPGYVALHGSRVLRTSCYDWLEDAERIATVDHHIWIYRYPAQPSPDGPQRGP